MRLRALYSMHQFLNNHRYKENGLPTGVYYDKSRKKYVAQMQVNGKNRFLGRHDTPQEASAAYEVARAERYAELVGVVEKQNADSLSRTETNRNIK